MSLDLKDIRAKVPVKTWAVIKGMAAAFDKEEGEIVRQVLTEWAAKMSHANSVTKKVLDVEGVTGSDGE